MYSVTVSHHFMIAHSLVGAVFGPAQQLHGATYVVEAEFRRDALDADGIVCDIGRALDLLKGVVGELDYRGMIELVSSATADAPEPGGRAGSPSTRQPQSGAARDADGLGCLRRADRMTELVFVVPGQLDQLTGGYLYDRRIVEELRARGRPVAVCASVAGRFG